MAWIKEEYAEEVAVVATWLVTFLPWSVSYATWPSVTGADVPDALAGSRLFFLRFPVFDLQLRFPTELTINGQVRETMLPQLLAEYYGGGGLVGSVHLVIPPLHLGAVDGPLTVGYALWTAASVLTLALFVLSVAMYLREEATGERLPTSYVTLTSTGFGALFVLLGGATAAFALADQAYGTPIPIGLLLVGALAVVLWRAERVSTTD